MKRLFARGAVLAAAIPLATCVVGAAYAGPTPSVTVPGCYGAGPPSAIVCDLTIWGETPDPTFSVMYVKVCVGTCHDVPVPWIWYEGAARVCYTYTDGNGSPVSRCTSDLLGSTPAIKPLVLAPLSCDIAQPICAYEE